MSTKEFDYQAFMNSSPGLGEIHRGPKARDQRRTASEGRISQCEELKGVFQIIQEITKISATGDYIYRGEPKHYSKVSSSLYREWSEIDKDINVVAVQNEILKEAKRFVYDNDELEILTQLQHYGGATNLIDFTTDYLVAMFFACDGSDLLNQNGRIILLEKSSAINKQLEIPRNPRNRVMAQKSIFVRPHRGFIEPDHVVNIPKALKTPILNYLWKCHDLSTAAIYNDLHGFIKFQKIHHRSHSKYFSGLLCQKKEAYRKAIEHYTEAIKLNPRLIDAYCNRGAAYSNEGVYHLAIEDYNKAIELDPDDVEIYFNRGLAQTGNGAFDLAIEDYNKAAELDPNDVEIYVSRGLAQIGKGAYDLAVEDYNKAIELNPDDSRIYFNRGNAHLKQGEYDHAVQDYNKAIELNPNDAKAYFNRGVIWLSRKNWPRAQSDLTAAKNLGIDILSAFRNDYQNVEGFQRQLGVRLPEDIVAMLTS